MKKRTVVLWDGGAFSRLCRLMHTLEQSITMDAPTKEVILLESNRYPTGMGSLPSPATLAFPYIPEQQCNPERYSPDEAMEHGTLFPGLNLPFKKAMVAQTKLTNTALVELMALDFAIDELGLYLTTHPDDKEVLDLYWNYCKLGEEGRKKYEKMYGPLNQTTKPADGSYAWLKDPWPWDEGGNH